ncbi:Six-hairpin glycosidase-like protein [Schizophyllum fasciatum]
MYIPGFFPLASALLNRTLHAGLPAPVLEQVADNLWHSAKKSWEVGVMAEALTEYNWPAYSVFGSAAFPPPGALNTSAPPGALNTSALPGTPNASALADVRHIVDTVLAAKAPGTLTLFADDSAGDPASLGCAVLLANWTRADTADGAYARAAADQLAYLLDHAPRTAEGAISHRTDEVQLWADSVYMVPPFLAYYGALQGGAAGAALLQAAYDQIRLYRAALADAGLWRHVRYGAWEDGTHWATGNGWAAAGMMRVLRTMNGTAQGADFGAQQADLASWIRETLDAVWVHQKPNGTLYNTLDDGASFADSAATALLAATTYRMAAFDGDALDGAALDGATRRTRAADRALALVAASTGADGWLARVVDPYTFAAGGARSPEAQAFVLLLHAARRDYAAQLGAPAA